MFIKCLILFLSMTNIYAETLSSLVNTESWLAETTGAAKANGWLYVITLTKNTDAGNENAQKLELAYSDSGADYRVVKSNNNGNPVFTPFNVSANSFSREISAVNFNRYVKIQLKQNLDISQVKINDECKFACAAPDLGATGNGRKLNNSIPFSATTLAAQAAGWNRVTTIVGGLNAGNGNSQAAQTMAINVTYAPGGAQYRILKTRASADPTDPFIGDSQNLVLGMNTITVPAVSWADAPNQGRDVRVQFSSDDIEFSILYKNGNVASYGISNTCDKFNGTYCGETKRIYAPINSDDSYKYCGNEKCDWENYFECCEYGQRCTEHTCPEATHVPKTDASSRYCADTSCGEDDTNECCNERGTCTENTCTETHVLKTDASTIYCTGTECGEDECCKDRPDCEINPDAKGHVNYIGTEVLDYAFKKCDTLTSFSGPNVTIIAENSFGTGLNAVYLPKFTGNYSGALPTFYKSDNAESNAELCTCFIDENELCLKKFTGVASCLAKDTVESAMQHCNSVKHAYNAQCGCN